MKPCRWSLIFIAILTAFAGQAALAQDAEKPHFHHVHLNVMDPEVSIEFYRKIFGAVPVKFRGVADAVFTERSFFLFNKVDTPAPGNQDTGIWHIGWGGVDIPNEAKWYKSQGVEVHTEIYPLGSGWVTYWNDPDKVMIEVNTMGHKRYAHVHLMAVDPNATAAWYAEHLGLPAPRRTPENNPKPVGPGGKYESWEEYHKTNRSWSGGGFRLDNVSVSIYNIPDYVPAPPWWPFEPLKEFKPQRGHAIDHFAVSYRDIDPVYERMKAAGVEIVEALEFREEYGMRSFFVAAPDGVTLEVVEAKPIPEGIWD